MCVFPGFFHLRVPESSAVGSAVGRIKAHDLDIGRNAEVEYTIVPGDGGNMFDITTNEHTQEGIIILRRVRRSSSSYTRVLSYAGVKYCTELVEYWIGTVLLSSKRQRKYINTRHYIKSQGRTHHKIFHRWQAIAKIAPKETKKPILRCASFLSVAEVTAPFVPVCLVLKSETFAAFML